MDTAEYLPMFLAEGREYLQELNLAVVQIEESPDDQEASDAIEEYQTLKPELTTLDITMPEKDGLAALEEIIAFDPGARVIMCSARDFVVKPFQPDRVIEAIGEALS